IKPGALALLRKSQPAVLARSVLSSAAAEAAPQMLPTGKEPGPMGSSRCRVALYSHDTMGLGHMRRNLLLAQALRHSRLQAVVLLIAGAREVSVLTGAAGVDCVALPSLRKDATGQYHPRHLEVSLQELLALRAKIALATLEAFDPDVLLVDNVPRGA